MKEFDYKRAYAELAEPAWKALPANVQALIARVCATAATVEQNTVTLDTEWPVDVVTDHGENALMREFLDIPSELLARAARAVYFAGHWAERGTDGQALQKDGAYWKFASYADQVLCSRLGLPGRGRDRRNGAIIEVHEGYLRLCVSTPDSWTWKEIGPATDAVYRAIREGLPPAIGGNASRAQWERSGYEAACMRLADTCRSMLRPTDGTPDLLDTERFVTEKI